MITHFVSGIRSSEKGKKVKGKAVLIERCGLDLKGIGDSVVGHLQDFLGQKVELRLVSATVGDPKNGNRGVVGPVAYLEKKPLPIIPAVVAGEKTYGVTFTVNDDDGIPGAVIVKNRHVAEFYLKSITIDNFPGKGRIHFDCNSFVYNCDKYSYDRVFFSNDPYLPKKTPDPLRPYREDELRNLRGDGVNRKLEKWDRVYNYAFYDDLGNPDAGKSLRRPVLGGSAGLPYPRRCKTARPPTKTDPHTESAPSLDSELYVPHDERLNHTKTGEFLGATMKTVAKDLFPLFQDVLGLKPNDFDSFNEVLHLYEHGLPLPDTPMVRKFLDIAPCEKFKAILMPNAGQPGPTDVPPFSPADTFKGLMPMMKAILNFKADEFNTFKEVLHLCKSGLPLPDIAVVRKFLEAAPGEKFKGIVTNKVGRDDFEDEPWKKLKNLVPMLKVIINFTPNQFDSFKEVFGLYMKGSPLPNIPLVQKFLEASPCGRFKDTLKRSVDQDNLFKFPEDVPLEKCLRELQPMLQVVFNLKRHELDIFKDVLNHYESGLPLPNLPLVHKFLEVAPCEKFTAVHLPGIEHSNLFQLSGHMPLEKFKDLIPTFQLILNLKPNEFDAFKDVLNLFKDGSPLPNHPMIRKVLEVAPCKKFKGTLPEDASLEEHFKDILPMLQVVMNLKNNEIESFKEMIDHYDDKCPLQDDSVVQKILEVAPHEENSKVVLTPTDYQDSLFQFPEVAPLEKYFNDLQPMLDVVMNLMPNELDSFKEVLDHYETGLPLPDTPLVQQFLDVAPCEDFKPVLIPSLDQGSFFEVPEVAPSVKFKDIFPMLHVLMKFTPTEIDSFKETINLYKSGLPLKDTPLVRKILEVAPNKKFKATLSISTEKDNNLFSLPEAEPLEKYFNDMLPMFHTVLNMKTDEFDSFKEVLDQYEDGLPLPDIPVVQNFLKVAPCEKFKTILMPTVDQDSLFRLPETAPLENYFKDLLPMLHFITNLSPNESESFKTVFNNYEGGLPLPDAPLIRKFLEFAPDQKFKCILTPNSPNLTKDAPQDKFKDLLPMLKVIVNFTSNEFDSFKEVLDNCRGGLPLPDTPQVRKFLEVVPYENFRAIISSAEQGCLFKMPESKPLEKYCKDLLPMLLTIRNFTLKELRSFKEVLNQYENGLPLPDTPLVQKFLKTAPCEKFEVVLVQAVEKDDGLSELPTDETPKKFKDLLPMLQVISNFTPNEFDSFKEVVVNPCEGGSPLPDIPVVRKFLEVKFGPDFIHAGDKGRLPEDGERYLKQLLPMLQMIMNLTSDEFNSFKKVLNQHEDGFPLPDIPVTQKFLEVAPCEKFKPVLKPSVDHDSLFRLPETAHSEKYFKDLVPMFQSIMNLKSKELNSFKEVLNHYEYGLPLPDNAVVRKLLEVAPDEKFKGVLAPTDDDQGNLFKSSEDAPLKKFKDIMPVLQVLTNFDHNDFNTVKKSLEKYEGGFPLPDIPLVRKLLEATPFQNLKEILTRNVEEGSLFKQPEAAPLEKYFKDLLPMLKVVFNMKLNELESFKEVLKHHEGGVPLPNIPVVQKFLHVAPCEKFKAVLMPNVDQCSLSRSQDFKPLKKFKDIFPMLQVLVNFTNDEMNSFNEVLDLCKHGSSLPDIPLVRKLFEAIPDEKFKAVLTINVDQGSLFSLPQAAPLEKFFKELVPMFETITNFMHDEFASFKEMLDNYKDGLPLPNTPLVQKFLKVAPCEKFKAILMPNVHQDSLFKCNEDAPLEKYFKDLLPQFQAIMNMVPDDLESFKKVLCHYEGGLPLPDIPLVQKFFEVAPNEKFKTLLTPSTDQNNLFRLPEIAPLENFKDLFPMLQVIINFTPNEFKSFKEVLDKCKDGLPLPDIPPVRKFLEVAPYEKFKTVLTLSVNQGNLFKLPEAAPMEKFFKDLLPMLQSIINFTPKEFDSFKDVLHRYETGLPLPNIPLISKFLKLTPCDKFKAVLTPVKEQDTSSNSNKDGPSEKFKDMLPMLNAIINLAPNELKSFKEVLNHCKGGSPLSDIPLVRTLLEVVPCEKFKAILKPDVEQGTLFSIPEAAPLEKYFKDLLPMLETFVNFTPNEFDSFKELLGHYENGLPLPDTPTVRKVLEVAPCEKFEAVLTPTIDQEGLFSLPENAHLEDYFKETLPLFQAFMNFTPTEVDSFKQVLHCYEYGLPLPDSPLVRKILKVAPDDKFKNILPPSVDQNSSSSPPKTSTLISSENVIKFKKVVTPNVDRSSFFKLPEVAPFEKFMSDFNGINPFSMFKLPMPKIIQEDKWAWATDEEFARQMLAGINPIIIIRLTEFPPRSKLDPKQFGNQNSRITAEIIQPNLDGLSIKQALDNNRLFILDHHDTVMPYLKRINATENKVYATRTILFLKKDGTLKPVAIELSLPTPEGKKAGVISQVYAPAGFGVEGAIWLLAKTFVIVNDSGVHQLISHWLRTHAAIEPFAIAMNRQLSTMHPLNKLLAPHFRHTMSINALYRQNMINAGGLLEFTSFPGKYAMEMSAAAYKNWNFVEQGLPADLIKRGIAVKNTSSPHHLQLLIQDYPYAVDGLEIWSAIENWVHEYCANYYDDDDAVKSDDELQSWWNEVREVGHGDLKDQQWWPKMSSFSDLVNSCTTVIWIASAMHAAVNFGQYHYAGYAPNRPAVSRRYIPANGSLEYEQLKKNPEKVIFQTIAGQLQTLIAISVFEIQSTHGSDEVYLGQRASADWTGDKRAVEGLNRFCSKLKKVEKKIADMNRDLALKNRTGPAKMAYTLLSPYSESGITGKGIPNSISI